MKNTLTLISILALFLACKKNMTETQQPTPEPNTDGSQYGTPFSEVPNRQDAVIYQVNMRAFSSGSNFAGVTARLDSIAALGVNVIYLMPIYPIGAVNAVNSPYCVRDYRSVNSEFGTLTDLRALIDGAHARHMAVILDWVANHTSWDNAWITNHSDWYLHDGSNNIVSPPGTGWNDVAQLDFTNAAMRTEMINCMKYWVFAANIDGFRCDYADGPPVDFWTQAVDSLRSISTHNLLLLAEGSRSANFTAGFDFNFGFNFYGQLKNTINNGASVQLLTALNSSEFTSATNGQQVVRYLTNHDVNGSDGTPQQLFGGQNGSMASFVVAAFMKGVPMIYNGQEVATSFQIPFPFTSVDINWNVNPAVKAQYKKLIAIRNNSVALRRGTPTSYSTADLCIFTKESGGETVLVIVNMRNSTTNYTLPTNLANSTWTDLLTGSTATLGTTVSMPGYGYVVLKQ